MPRQRRRRRSGARRVVLIALVVAALPLLGWTAVSALSGLGEESPSASVNTDDTSRSNGTTGDSPSPDPSSTTGSYEVAQAARTALTSCATRLAAGQAAVDQADIGVGHWNEHIQARTDLLAGRNTDAQTREIWKRTRLAGPDDQARFAAALAAFNKLPACDIDTAVAPEGLLEEIQACVGRIAATDAALAAGTAGMADWTSHLDNMAAHAHGEMTATQAQTMWVEAWESAPTNINGFRDARVELDQAPDCRGAD